MRTGLSFAAWFVFFYLYHGLGITLGYHRLLTHKALKLPNWLTYSIVSGGYLMGLGAPIPWVGPHRLHHQKSDADGDPHSPKDGFIHSLWGWVFKVRDYQTDQELQKVCADLMVEPLYRKLGITHCRQQSDICLAVCAIFRVLIFILFGPVALAANLVATVVSAGSAQLVNSVCHLPDVGYRSHETRDMTRNVWWVGILALGEGWHNNHHAMARSARHGMKWFEVDVTWYAILLLEKLGLATAVVRPPKLLLQAAVDHPEDATAVLEPVLANSD